MPTPNLKSKKGRVRILTSRHGLGDCHLIRFKKQDGSFFHILIDCGVVDRTTDPKTLMTRVAKDIAAETDTLDVLIATHQHTDHLSGFKQAKAVFDTLTIQEIWFSWMDAPGNKVAKKLQDELVKKITALRGAAAKMSAFGMASIGHVEGLLDFIGPGPGAAGDDTQAIIESLRKRPDSNPVYRKTGETFLLPDLPEVRVYVLGPPAEAAYLRVQNPRKSKHEGYEALALGGDSDGFAAAICNGCDGHPFEARHRNPACAIPSYDDPAQAWRKIDQAWLDEAEKLALYLDKYINNTSLALAFEFVDTGEVLLFPGDAQVGNWMSWYYLSWKVPGPDGLEREIRVPDLLARTVFYKGSHHASHNGTPRETGEGKIGLEQMTHDDLVCVVPVDLAMSKLKKWDRTLPWEPLLKRLGEKTRGRLVLTDTAVKPPVASKLDQLSPAEQKRFAGNLSVNDDWVEYVL